jgi:hypothetical protein
MWRDEVRAFSVATRSASWADLVRSLHAEAHPILWYALLRVGYGVTHSMLVLPVTALVIAAIAAFVILRFAPFPVWIRLLCVFGVYLGHEYSVVSRNYGIGILLMLAVAVMFSGRHERPIRVGLALALLANTSVPAALASLVLSFVWVLDAFDPGLRDKLARPRSLAAIAIALCGAAIAWATASPSPDMVYAFSASQLHLAPILRAILIDPGASLSGNQLASITAAEQIPWSRMSLDPEVMTRLIADIAILSVAWSLRRNRACLAGLLLGIFGFEVLFRLVYAGSLRHEGILAFLMITLTWIAITEPETSGSPGRRRSMTLGLVPLLAVQTIALPIVARRELLFPTSSSKAFAQLIQATPRYKDAILMSEPDYLMETMPYYVANRVFMPRQREFNFRVYFDRGARRSMHFGLGTLVDIANSVSCATGKPVLLAIGYLSIAAADSGSMPLAYGGAAFRWNADERRKLFSRGMLIHSFVAATSDEKYHVFEIPRPGLPACAASSATSFPDG